jgi:hypothetical protein
VNLAKIVSHVQAYDNDAYDKDGNWQWGQGKTEDIHLLHNGAEWEKQSFDMSTGAYAFLVDMGPSKNLRTEGIRVFNHGNVKDVEVYTCQSDKFATCANWHIACRYNHHDWTNAPECTFWKRNKNKKKKVASEYFLVKVIAEDRNKPVELTEIEFFADVSLDDSTCLWSLQRGKSVANVDSFELEVDGQHNLVSCKKACADKYGKQACYGFSYTESENKCVFWAQHVHGGKPQKAPSCTVTMYEHGDFSGWSAEYRLDSKLDSKEWNYDQMVAGGAHNDGVSSFKITEGCMMTTFNHGQLHLDRSGHAWEASFGPGDYDHDAMTSRGAHNDAISSFKLFRVDGFPGCQDQCKNGVQTWSFGSLVLIKGANGKYCADEGDKIICNRDNADSWERFRVLDAGHGKIGLAGGFDNKICADESGHSDNIVCNRGNLEGWEIFSVEDAGKDNQVYLKGKDGSYCHDGGHERLNCGHEKTAALTIECYADCIIAEGAPGEFTDSATWITKPGTSLYTAECQDPQACPNYLPHKMEMRVGQYIQNGLANVYMVNDGALVITWNGIVIMQTMSVDVESFHSIGWFSCPSDDDINLLPNCKEAAVGQWCRGKEETSTEAWGQLPWHQHLAKGWHDITGWFDTECGPFLGPKVKIYELKTHSKNVLKIDEEKAQVQLVNDGWVQWYWQAGEKDHWANCKQHGVRYELAKECPASEEAAKALPECENVNTIGHKCRGGNQGSSTCSTDLCEGKCHNCNYDYDWDDWKPFGRIAHFYNNNGRYDIYTVVANGQVAKLMVADNGHLQVIGPNGQLLANANTEGNDKALIDEAIKGAVGAGAIGLGLAGLSAAIAAGTFTAAWLSLFAFVGMVLGGGFFLLGGLVCATASVGVVVTAGAVWAGSYGSLALVALAAGGLFVGPLFVAYGVGVTTTVTLGASMAVMGASIGITTAGGVGATLAAATVVGGSGAAMSLSALMNVIQLITMEELIHKEDFPAGDCGTYSRTAQPLPVDDKCYYNEKVYTSPETMKAKQMSSIGLADIMMTEKGALQLNHNGELEWTTDEYGEGTYAQAVHPGMLKIKDKDGNEKWSTPYPTNEQLDRGGCPTFNFVDENACPSKHTLKNLGACNVGRDTYLYAEGEYCYADDGSCGTEVWYNPFKDTNCMHRDYSDPICVWYYHIECCGGPWWNKCQCNHNGWRQSCTRLHWDTWHSVYQVTGNPPTKFQVDYDGALEVRYGDTIVWSVGDDFWTGIGCTRNEVLQNTLPAFAEKGHSADTVKKAIHAKQLKQNVIFAFGMSGLVAVAACMYAVRKGVNLAQVFVKVENSITSRFSLLKIGKKETVRLTMKMKR